MNHMKTRKMSDSNINQVFSKFQEHLEADHQRKEDIRLVVKDMEQTAREILTLLQTVHQSDGIKNVSAVCEKCDPMFVSIQQGMANLATKIPDNQYYRYSDIWRFLMQRLCFLTAFLTYLQSETLVTREQVVQKIGVKLHREEGFHMDLDDYLSGLLQLASELSRFAVNAVTAGDYARPVRIARFIGELDSGFRLLNLKNDHLRKRFDGLKYDLKKVEEVVYDLTIRGLKPAE